VSYITTTRNSVLHGSIAEEAAPISFLSFE
jgi:hypothetical protein